MVVSAKGVKGGFLRAELFLNLYQCHTDLETGARGGVAPFLRESERERERERVIAGDMGTLSDAQGASWYRATHTRSLTPTQTKDTGVVRERRGAGATRAPHAVQAGKQERERESRPLPKRLASKQAREREKEREEKRKRTRKRKRTSTWQCRCCCWK